MAAADYDTVVQQLYVAYFGRPADVDGLANFTAALDATGVEATAAGVEAAYNSDATIKALVDSFGNSDESAALYGSGNTEAFVIAIYANVLNRAPDKEGFDFWFDAINNGVLSRGNAALSIMAGALANESEQGQADAALVNARITVATSFTTAITTEGATYSGDDAAAAAREMLATVTADTDTTAFQSTIVSTLAAITNPGVGSTFTLTTAADTFSGTSLNDTFSGTTATFGSDSDTIVDGSSSDNDTLNLTAVTADIVAADFSTVAGVENVNVTTQTAAAFAMDAVDFTGVENLTISRADLADGLIDGTGAVTVTNVNATKIAKVTSGDQVTNFIVTQAAKAGATVNADTATGNVTVTGAATISAAGAGTGDTVTVNALADATEDAKAVSVTADNAATVTVAAGFTGAVTVNAAKATAVTVSNAAGGATVTAASANTTATTITVNGIDNTGATITAGTFAATTSTGTIALAGGVATDDTATVSAAGVVTLNSTTVDILNLSGNGADVTYTIGAGAVYDKITASGDFSVNVKTAADDVTGETVTGVNTLTLNAAGTGAIDLSNVTTTSIEFDADIDQAITVATGATITFNADQNASTATTELIAKADNATLSLIAGDDTVGSTASTILLGDLDLDGASTDFSTVSITADTAALTATSVVADDAAITISGSKAVTLGQVTAGSVNANSMTGVLSATMFATTASLTSGSGNDVLIMNNNAGSTVMALNAGAGNNTVTVTDVANGSTVVTGAGTDTINLNDTTSIVVQGGDGNDTYNISVAADAVIADTAGTDKIVFTAAGSLDMSALANFSFAGIESIDVTATGGTTTFDGADLTGKTLSIVGDGAGDVVLASGDDGGTATVDTIDLSDLTISGTATIQIDGGDKADILVGSATASTNFLINDGDFDAGETITGGSATDTITLGAAADLSVGTISSVEVLATAGFAATIGQGTGIISVTGYANATADTFILTKSTTSFEAAEEASAAAVDIAGEWFLQDETAAPADAVLTYFDEVLGEAVSITLVGTGGGADDSIAVVAGNLVYSVV